MGAVDLAAILFWCCRSFGGKTGRWSTWSKEKVQDSKDLS